MGDGELNEGQIWEAAMTSSHYALDNLCGIVDFNKQQIDGWCSEVMNLEPLAEKWRAITELVRGFHQNKILLKMGRRLKR